jgi:hypothetical protein
VKLNFPETQHVNFVPFEGIAAFLDSPMDRPAHIYAASGRVIGEVPLLLTRAGVEAAVPSLIGMALCFHEQEFLYHVPRSKCGVILEAWIDGDVVRIRGGIYGQHFPDVIAEIEKNNDSLALCPLTYDAVFNWNTLSTHGYAEVSKMTFTGVALMRNTVTGFTNTSIRLLDRTQT